MKVMKTAQIVIMETEWWQNSILPNISDVERVMQSYADQQRESFIAMLNKYSRFYDDEGDIETKRVMDEIIANVEAREV